MTGDVVMLDGRAYVAVNNEGTLMRIQKPSGFRIFLWHLRNFFKPFKNVNETLDFLFAGGKG